MRTPAINAALEKTISRTRLDKYLVNNGDNLDLALQQYERNTKLSEAFYTPLQCLEICLRNCLHSCMANKYGEDWMRNNAPPLRNESVTIIGDLINAHATDLQPMSVGALVAELKFGFWVGLLGPPYDATIWRGCLYRAFLPGGGKPRSVVHGRLNALRRFRNRVAHHEPIIWKPLGDVHNEIVEAIGWMCSDTKAWSVHHSRVPTVLANP